MCRVLNVARADIVDYIEVFYNRVRRHQSGGLRTGLVVRTEFVYRFGVSPTTARKYLDYPWRFRYSS